MITRSLRQCEAQRQAFHAAVPRASARRWRLKNWKMRWPSRVHVGGRFVPAFRWRREDREAPKRDGTTIIAHPGVFTPEDGGLLCGGGQDGPVKANSEEARRHHGGPVEFEAHFSWSRRRLRPAAAATNSCGTVPGNTDKSSPGPSKTLSPSRSRSCRPR